MLKKLIQVKKAIYFSNSIPVVDSPLGMWARPRWTQIRKEKEEEEEEEEDEIGSHVACLALVAERTGTVGPPLLLDY